MPRKIKRRKNEEAENVHVIAIVIYTMSKTHIKAPTRPRTKKRETANRGVPLELLLVVTLEDEGLANALVLPVIVTAAEEERLAAVEVLSSGPDRMGDLCA